MPGNEVGDSIHNFLGQESLSLGQHHSQLVDSTWPGLSNNLWVGSQRQVGPLVSNVKNFSVNQLAEFDRGHSGQTSSLQHGLNFKQSGMRPEIARNQSQNQSSIANGCMQVPEAFQVRQNETNFLGVGTASRGLSVLDSHIENGPDLHEKNSLRLESTESPINYDFLGGQQQVNGQHPGMIQPLPRQQSGMADMQLLQQHSILNQMQEFQRQQLPNPQFQLSEARQLSSANQVSSFVKQGSGSLSPAPINGVPVHDTSNYSWQPELMTPNANWLQHDAFSSMQGYSGEFMFSPEQGQVRLMGLVPQQDNQSFNGVFNGGARGNSYQYLSVQMDKPLLQQVPASSNSFPGNQYAMLSDEVGLQASVSRQGDQGKNVFGAAAVHGLNSVFDSENLQQMIIQPKNAVLKESHGRQEHPGPSETSLEKSAIQAVLSQNVASLDPTEEKILFGSDDNVWDIFGKSTNMGAVLDGTDSFGEFPSLQSGSWSALMLSAVAETSSNDIMLQEEWSGLAVQNSEPSSGNNLPGVDNNLQNTSTLNSKPFPMSTDVNINRDFCSTLGVQQSGVRTANEQTGRMHNDSCQRFVQQLTEERSKWLDCSPLQRPVAESAQLFGNVAHSLDVQASAKSISGHQDMAIFNPRGQPHNKANGWNFIESASRSGGAISKCQDIESSSQPSHGDHKGVMCEERGNGSDLDRPVPDANIGPWNVNSGLGSPQMNMEGSDMGNVAAVTDSRTTRVNKESSRQLPNGHNLNLWKSIDSKVNSGVSRVSAKYQQNPDKSHQSFDSSGNNYLDKGMSEANMLESPNVKETSNDSFRSNLSHHTSTGGIIDNGWLDADYLRAVEQKSSVHGSCKPSGAHKFQYQPGAKKLDDQIAWAGGSGATEFPAGSPKPQNSVGEEQPAKGQQLLSETDASQNPASVQRDIEAFGRSLRPNNIIHQKYSLLHQVQALKNMEIDPSNRSVKRFKGPTLESSLDAQHVSQGADQLPYGSNNVMRDALVNCPIVPSEDSKMLSLSSNAGDYHETQLSANDAVAFAKNDSLHVSNANNSAGSLRGEHSQIRPQMAPSWFDQHEAFKNGQMLPKYDARKIAMMKATDKALIVGRSSDSLHALDSNEQVNAADASQLDDTRQNSNLLPIASEQISRHLLPPGIPNQNLIVVRAKKRKSMTFELVSWHREVTQGCPRPQNISAAEAEWAHAANRLIEKVEYEPEMIEDWPPVLRSKRRLILTTQLMQQLHCAPPRAVLSADASKNYETVVYFVVRLGLGEACSTAYIPESDTVPSESGSTLSEKLKERKQSILKAAEEFVIRTKKLENDLQSLDKRASILDLRLECQDLEKISLINRFAKFYGRGQADRAETSSSSEAIAGPPKFFLQRYVSALPMPRNLPDKVQCLSL